MVKIADLTITSLDTLTAWKLNGDYWFTLDELQDATIANTQDKEDITGRAGRKINSIKRNKAVTVSGNNGMLSGGLLEAQTGSEWEVSDGTELAEAINVQYTEVLVVNEGKVRLSHAAVGTAGSEVDLYVKQNDSEFVGLKLEQVASGTPETMSGQTFLYNSETGVITFGTQTDVLRNGDEVLALYRYETKSGGVLINDSTKFSGKAHVIIDATAEDKCGNIYHVQYDFPKGDFNGEFDIEMGDSQNPHAWEFESLAGACGAGGELWTMYVFGED